MKQTTFSRIQRVAALMLLSPVLGLGIMLSMLGEAASSLGRMLVSWSNRILESTGAPKVRQTTHKLSNKKRPVTRLPGGKE